MSSNYGQPKAFRIKHNPPKKLE
jgi:hypothetical protein